MVRTKDVDFVGLLQEGARAALADGKLGCGSA